MGNFPRLFLIVMALTIVAGISSVHAKIQLKPMITVQVQQDSNFYRTEVNEREVITYGVTPGINLASKTPRSNIYANYSFTYNSYDYQDPPSTPEAAAYDRDSFVEHAAMLEADYAINHLTTAKLASSYHKTIDQAHGDALSNEMERREFDIFRIRPLIKGTFPIIKRFPLQLAYRYSNLDYEDPEYADSTEDRIMVDTYYKLGSGILEHAVGIQYHHWWTKYSGGSPANDTSDYQSDQIRLTGQYQLEDITLDAAAGYQWRTFDDENMEDLDAASISLALNSGELLRILGRKADATVKYIRNLNATDGGDGYFVADRFSFDLGYNIFRGIESKANGYWQNSQYEEGLYDGREDDSYGLSGMLGYKWSILGNKAVYVALKGGYEWRDSNFPGYDFDNTFLAAILSADMDTAFLGVDDAAMNSTIK